MKRIKPKHWFAVHFDDKGGVRSVSLARIQCSSTLAVIYVFAATPDDAAAAGYRMRQRMLQTRRRAEYEAQGLCRCGRPRDVEGKRRCSLCASRGRAYQQRAKLQSEGERIIAPPKREAFKRLAAENRENTRLAVLLEVRELWRDTPNNGVFTRWLEEAIRKLEKRAA